eukprot:14621918-Alexandrium_andersonii.AAC.1
MAGPGMLDGEKREFFATRGAVITGHLAIQGRAGRRRRDTCVYTERLAASIHSYRQICALGITRF